MAPTMPLKDSRARAEQAFGLRSIGRTWREIAAQLGYQSHGAVQLAVARHIARTDPESVDTTRRAAIESLRLTSVVLFDRFAAAIAREDDQTAALLNRELRGNRDQLAKLTGAYVAEKVDVSHDVAGMSVPALIEALRTRAMAAVAERAHTPAVPRAMSAVDVEEIG